MPTISISAAGAGVTAPKPAQMATKTALPKIAAILLLEDGEFIPGTTTYNLEICGKKMRGYVEAALKSFPLETLEIARGENFLERVKPLLTDAEITIVLYSDTPLVLTNVLKQAVAHISAKNQEVFPLPRGYIFKTEYLRRNREIRQPQITYLFEDNCFMRADSPAALCAVQKIIQKQIVDYHTGNGVIFSSPESVVLDADVRIEAGARINERVHLKGASQIAAGASLFDSVIENSIIGAGANIQKSVVSDSEIGANAQVGPFSSVKKQSVIGAGAQIGNFVEIKNSKIGSLCKIKHHAYVGDAEVGSRTNIGCGVVFCNYDGKTKNKATVGEDCFIGANCNLIAPIEVADGAYIAAGSTLSKSLIKDSFMVARPEAKVRQNRAAASADKNAEETVPEVAAEVDKEDSTEKA